MATTPTTTTDTRTTDARDAGDGRATSPLDVLSTSAYVLVGAADRALEQARDLAGRRDELPEEVTRQIEEATAQLRQAVDRALEHLGGRVRTTRDEAESTIDAFAERGESILRRLRSHEEVGDAADDAEQARRGWLAALTSLRRATEQVGSRVKAAGTMTGKAAGSAADAADSIGDAVTDVRDEEDLSRHTKEELYELATQRDIEGRSTMNKQELVTALRRAR